MQGKIGTFSMEKGYGFIFVTFKERFFFHFSNWNSEAEPTIDQTVNFDVAPGRRTGTTQAVNVTPVVTPVTEDAKNDQLGQTCASEVK
jgi:cold shock CspA family protein